MRPPLHLGGKGSTRPQAKLPGGQSHLAIATWKCHSLLAYDPHDARHRLATVRGLVNKCSVIGLQEVHGTRFKQQRVLKEFAASHYFDSSCCENVAVGGVALLIARSACPQGKPVFEELIPGRVLTAKMSGEGSTPWSVAVVHNYDFKDAERQRLRRWVQQCRNAGEELFLFGDFNFAWGR